jgi:hypothetical protein
MCFEVQFEGASGFQTEYSGSKSQFMVVRIRFGPGRVVTRRKGKNSKAALLLASLLTLVAISLGALGLWRLGQDLGFLGDFVFPTGLLSHWQVWMAGAIACQYACWRLTRYSMLARRVATEPVVETENEPVPSDEPAARLGAN